MANALGECKATDQHGVPTCRGDLCISGKVVRCMKCGAPQPDHPMMRKAVGEEVVPTAPIEVRPADMVASVPDRVTALERALQSALERIVRLEAAARRKG